jgi:hypothetical protein
MVGSEVVASCPLGITKEVDVKRYIVSVLAMGLVVSHCGKQRETPKDAPAEVAQKATPAPEEKSVEKTGPLSGHVLLVAQSQFKANEKGLYTVPDKAVLAILKPNGGRWEKETIEDTESNVFHKALPYGKEGILTLGGNEAKLKLWQRKEGKWQSTVLWHPTFGGKHNRLRDMEIADFNGDGADDLAIVTHDQGVVAVVWRRGEKWEPEELDRRANTFVHEAEVGDLDKDGALEFYATPSKPNTVDGKDQGGEVVRFTWKKDKFEKSTVVARETRHVKEILVADVDGDGNQELYAAMEAEVDGPKITSPVKILRFDPEGDKFKEREVAEIDDRFCRFLVAGDIDQDGKKELVAAAFSKGVFVIEEEEAGYKQTNIDPSSGGFEHAAYIADIDDDGKKELYVADDKSGLIRRYDFQDGAYKKTIVDKRQVPSQAMVWNITEASL